uniref:Uncharacterized protein n=1 Tax=Oryza meridionalis TaxID=40149 RepID=A0A0E0F2W9_9ORYZ
MNQQGSHYNVVTNWRKCFRLQRIQDSDWMMMMETQYYIFRGLSFGVRDNYKSRTMKKIAQKTEILGSRDEKIT